MCVYNLLRRENKIDKIQHVKSKPGVIRRRKTKGSSLGQPVASSKRQEKEKKWLIFVQKGLSESKLKLF